MKKIFNTLIFLLILICGACNNSPQITFKEGLKLSYTQGKVKYMQHYFKQSKETINLGDIKRFELPEKQFNKLWMIIEESDTPHIMINKELTYFGTIYLSKQRFDVIYQHAYNQESLLLVNIHSQIYELSQLDFEGNGSVPVVFNDKVLIFKYMYSSYDVIDNIDKNEVQEYLYQVTSVDKKGELYTEPSNKAEEILKEFINSD